MSRKGKTLKLMLLMLAVVLGCVNVEAYDFTSGGYYYNILSSNGDADEVAVTYKDLTGTAEYKGLVILPEQVFYNGKIYKVAAIGDNAFAHCALTSIQIPNTVKSIGEKAFLFAEDLADVTLPLNLQNIEANTFEGTAIANVAVPEGVTNIGNGAFQSCLNLHTVFLPSTLKKIEAYGFNNCHSLAEIYCSAPSVVSATGWAIFISLTNIDLIVPESLTESYGNTAPWNVAETFNIYPSEPVQVSMVVDGKDTGEYDELYLGNNLAFKIYDGEDMVAVTSADNYYLPHKTTKQTYRIVPTNYFADGDEFTYEVKASSGVDNVVGDAEAVKIYAHNGIIYITGDVYGRNVKVYDAYGTLWRAQKVAQGEIENLPRGKVYVVLCGNTIKKVKL